MEERHPGLLASIHYADAMLGKVLAALEASPHAQNTIVVLWSDHGWHLGEKNHWQKFTGWRACTRVPLIVRVPSGTPGLTTGTKPSRCNKPVNLVSLFPTLLELCGLPANPEHDGPSLVPLLRDTSAGWPHVSVTCLGQPGSYGLSGEHWRLIHYANGDEELYDIELDPTNGRISPATRRTRSNSSNCATSRRKSLPRNQRPRWNRFRHCRGRL